MFNILVLCTGNSCRSQIAHGYLRHFTDTEKVAIYSAGIETHGVNPLAIATMRADGIDIAQHTSNNVDEYAHLVFDVILTVCDNANERCPVFIQKTRKLHYNFADPAKALGTEAQINAAFEAVRLQIKLYCAGLVAGLGL